MNVRAVIIPVLAVMVLWGLIVRTVNQGHIKILEIHARAVMIHVQLVMALELLAVSTVNQDIQWKMAFA